jgi:hypothetical protein
MKSSIYLNLACEDKVHEAILQRIVDFAQGRFQVANCYRHGGYGYLKKSIAGFHAASKQTQTPFFVLTDLDDIECPASLIENWLPGERDPRLLFRVAVREAEAWLLADRKNFASYLRISEQKLPREPESLPDPKATLIELAKSSRIRKLREGIVPAKGMTAKQGPDYNGCLLPFIQSDWNLQEAAGRSRSLAKAIQRLLELERLVADNVDGEYPAT